MLLLLPSWNDGGDPWGGLHDCRQHSMCVKVPRPKATRRAFCQHSLFVMTSAPMVTVSTSVSTHEDAHKCIEAVQRIFPDFQPEGEFSIEKLSEVIKKKLEKLKKLKKTTNINSIDVSGLSLELSLIKILNENLNPL